MTYEELEELYRKGKATMPVDHFNHREFVHEGTRWFAGYSSKGVERFSPEHGRNIRTVEGWVVYKREKAA